MFSAWSFDQSARSTCRQNTRRVSERSQSRLPEMVKKHLTAIIAREGPEYGALCPELDIAGQGETIEEARHNLLEAIELFFLSASESEIQSRLHDEVYVTQLEVCVG